jgi:lysyl-tRNA synthetase, class II
MSREDQIINERLKKLDALKSNSLNPYSSRTERKHSISEIRKAHEKLKVEQKSKDKVIAAGRLMSIRDLGKIAFGTINDGTAAIQILLQEPETPQKVFEFIRKFVDVGDFIEVEGPVTVTKRGELSVLIKKSEILTKSLLPLPEKWHGLKDDEERLRKRYLDILMNQEVKEMFLRKSKFWQTVRELLLSKGFIEVETPVLETAAGGAAATPFKTHHNALDIDVYLRISMGELWQKRLMVAGFPKTFEIGRQFRNEGMDADHLQDYTQMEFYWGYADYNDGMSLVKEIFREIAKKVFGKTKFERNGHVFDLAKEWDIIDYAAEIKKQTKIEIWKATSSEIAKKLVELKEPFEKDAGKFQLVDTLWKHCRRKISGPAFLTGQPVEITPLAKRDSKNPNTVQQFQVILAGTEAGNGYSELNDPTDQEARFVDQRKLGDASTSDAHPHDAEFIEALKYGMPPTCGFGMSERVFALLEGKPVRECVIFPLMRPLDLNNSSPKEK